MLASDEDINVGCPLCLNRFYDPVILQCGHSFDRKCILKYIHSKFSNNVARLLRCPLCMTQFDSSEPLVPNCSLNNLVISEPTYEWFILDVTSLKQHQIATTFLTKVFHKRDIFETNHITFENENVRMGFSDSAQIHDTLMFAPVLNLNALLEGACDMLNDAKGIRKICIITDGYTKHNNLTSIDSNVIQQRLIVHFGTTNARYVRELADKINFHFAHFDEKTLDTYVLQFVNNF